MKNPARRVFLEQAVAAGAVSLSGLGALHVLTACALPRRVESNRRARGLFPRGPASYGNLAPVADQNGDAILALPRGFSYVTFSRIGDPMSDGSFTPCNLDGMGAFPGKDGAIRLIRNHEVRNLPGDWRGAVNGPQGARYDPLGMAGTVTIDYDPVDKRVVQDFVSLNGTLANCAGGHAIDDAGWLNCEEITEGPPQGWEKRHGYAFLTPISAQGPALAKPILGMGRFQHEAAVAEPSGIVYQTEDAGPGFGSGFYRFLPDNPADLLAGGELQMLGLKGRPRADLREGQNLNSPLPATWVSIAASDPDLENGAPSVFEQGYAQGGAMFNRLEGLHTGEDGSIYFTSTSGGDAKSGEIDPDKFAVGFGQLWRYTPARDELALVYESPGANVLDSPDQFVVTPGGGYLICEDDASYGRDMHPLAPGVGNVNRLIGLTPGFHPFEFAVNRLNNTELSGACFSPDGDTLFVNVYGDGTQGSGMTCAITGPWSAGPL